jgi:hypothetical protein
MACVKIYFQLGRTRFHRQDSSYKIRHKGRRFLQKAVQFLYKHYVGYCPLSDAYLKILNSKMQIFVTSNNLWNIKILRTSENLEP